jgi:uncharacterized protein Yka (UPF0111/DUF47 family)
MFSLQRILGRDDEFCALLEASAREGVTAVAALRTVLLPSANGLTLETFRKARRHNKEITLQIIDLQMHTLVTSFEREDIEAVAEALYKIPKTVEKFAERYLLSLAKVRDFDFTRQMVLVEEATKSVLEMVQAFRAMAGVAEIKRLDSRIQRLENEADDVMLDFVGQLVDPEFPSLQGIILKDLAELNEKVVDRCRDASGVITRVTMKIF